MLAQPNVFPNPEAIFVTETIFQVAVLQIFAYGNIFVTEAVCQDTVLHNLPLDIFISLLFCTGFSHILDTLVCVFPNYVNTNKLFMVLFYNVFFYTRHLLV
jgi:hypothetical protein